MRQSIFQSLIAAAMLGVSQGAMLRPHQQYAQDFEESETAGEYFNSLAQVGRQCRDTFPRLSAEQPDIAKYEEEGAMYTDKSFPESEAMAGLPKVNWIRASEVFPEEDGYTLFKDNTAAGISFHDVKQGALATYWVLSTIAAIAEYPERIYNMFDQKKLNKAGIYTIRMYSLGVPVSVLIDDYIPETLSEDNENNFVKVTPEKELWPVFMEKAFAKLFGTYLAINKGWPTDAGLALMGSQGKTLNHSSMTTEELWDYLKVNDAKKSITQCFCMIPRYGLTRGQSYTTLGVMELSNGLKLVKVRNPFGIEKYTGPWNDSDPQWTEQFRKEAGMVSANDGTFFLPIDTYKRGFIMSMSNPDSTNWHHSYFLSLNNKELGEEGACGENCRRNAFTIESDTDQIVHITANIHPRRGYVSSECGNTAGGYHTAELLNGAQRIDIKRFQPRAYFGAREMVKGQKLNLVVETDWRSASIQPDFSVTAWGEGSKVKITHDDGALSDHYPLMEQEPKPEPEKPFAFEDFADTLPFPESCNAGIRILDTKQNDQKAIHLSHDCEGYKLKVLIAMTSSDYRTQVEQVTEEHQYSLSKCRIDKSSRIGCIFEIPEGESHALSLLMKSSWTPYLRYKHVWIKDEQ